MNRAISGFADLSEGRPASSSPGSMTIGQWNPAGCTSARAAHHVRVEASPFPERRTDIELRPWRRDDLDLMRGLLGDPAMTTYLGGPESPEQLRSRLERYVTMAPDAGRVFVITAGPAREPAGSIVFWAHPVREEPALEIGWSVLPAFQGRGIATLATARCLRIAAAATGYRMIHAFPSVDNGASNAVCRKLGFALLDTAAFEYPAGHWMTCNDWAFELDRLRQDRDSGEGA